MKVLKLIIGSLAALFVIAHVVEIPRAISAVGGSLATSWWLGKLAAILIGAAISIACFKSALQKRELTQAEQR